MRRLIMLTISVLALSSVMANTLQAGANFITGPMASLSTTTGDYTVSFKEAGLGNTPVTYTLTAATETFTFECFNKGGNKPQGDPNGISFSNVSTQTTLTPRNGHITGSISLIPQASAAVSCHGSGLLLFLTEVDYEGVTFTDTTNGITVAMPSLSASGLKVGPF